ncbi:MAG: DUF3179 domain-containing protein [Phycisphaera sp.]|nr:DUF3179 domain-containing protein [Phycisphaera sp.]
MSESVPQPEAESDDGRTLRRPPVNRTGKRVFTLLMVVLFGLSVAAVVLNLYWMYAEKASYVGNGRDLDTYGFDLSNLTVPRDTLVALPIKHKDAKPAILEAEHITVAEVDNRNARFGSYIRYMVSHDPVVGVTINGESRAYPVRFIRFHEVVNDTLGGVPIAVTYSPLTDSAVVFDRRVNGETLTFGYSGLLSNSNLVMYDRRPNAVEQAAGGDNPRLAHARADSAGESLWVQLRFEAVSGPMAGAKLTVLPLWYGTWHEWLIARPDTTVLERVNQYAQWYKEDPYKKYFADGEPAFPTGPLPPRDGGLALMDRVLVQRGDDGATHAVSETELANHPDATPGETIARSCWFAWYAVTR